MSTAIDFASHVSVSRLPAGVFEHPIRLFHEEVEHHQTVAAIRHPLLRRALEMNCSTPPIEIHSAGDLPPGLGLGSSSSFSVALLAALDALAGHSRTPLELAYEAIALERHESDGAVGYQDQVIAALGGLRHIEFRAEDDVRATPLAMDDERMRELEAHLLLVLVGGARPAQRLERRKLERVERNRETLRRMVAQVDRACDLLCNNGSLAAMGEMLDIAWKAKRSLAPGVSTPEIDALYQRCLEAGALGGKLLGAGAGGFLLLFVPPERRAAVTTAAEPHPTLSPRIAQPGVRVLNDG